MRGASVEVEFVSRAATVGDFVVTALEVGGGDVVTTIGVLAAADAVALEVDPSCVVATAALLVKVPVIVVVAGRTVVTTGVFVFMEETGATVELDLVEMAATVGV